jgi:hypothetical protein
MGRQIEESARFVARTTITDVPEPLRREARLVVLYTLAVIVAGSERPEVGQLRDRLVVAAGRGAMVDAPGWSSQDPRIASSAQRHRQKEQCGAAGNSRSLLGIRS